jgi:hypothetical protein
MALSTGLRREDIHDPLSELRRIPLLRGWVNKGKKKIAEVARPRPLALYLCTELYPGFA